jgi:Glycosyltransferase family 87
MRRRTRTATLATLATGGAFFCLVVALYALLRERGNFNASLLRKTDFLQFYTVGRLLITGRGTHIYDLPVLGHLETLIQNPAGTGHAVLPYLDLPYFAVLLAPLSILSFLWAYTVWLAVNCLLLGAVLVLLTHYARLRTPYIPYVALATILFPPVLIACFQGQTSIFLLALLTTTVLAASVGWDGVAGVALALALVKPPFALPLLIVFVVQRRWRTVRAFGITLTLLLVVPVAFIGVTGSEDYLRLLAHVIDWQGRSGPVTLQHVFIASATYGPRTTNSLAGMLQLLLSPRAARTVSTTCAVLLLLLLAACAHSARSLEAPLGLAVIVALLISPHVLVHDLSLMLVPMALTWRYRTNDVTLAALSVAGAYLLTFIDLPLSFSVSVHLSLFASLALLACIAIQDRDIVPGISSLPVDLVRYVRVHYYDRRGGSTGP